MSVVIGVAQPASPTPTTKRSAVKSSQSPSGTSAIAPEPAAQMKVPATNSFLRPQASESEPQASAPRIAPTPPESSIAALCP